MFRFRLLISNLILLAALLVSSVGRRQGEVPVRSSDFLKNLNLPFRGLKTSDAALSTDELSLLQPDAALVRRYSSTGGVEAELAVVAGHQKRSIHTPGFCMLGGGWDILWQQYSELTVPARTEPIPTIQMMMGKDGSRLLVTYFFTDGAFCTASLLQFQGFQFVRRLHFETHEGALVRIMVPVRTDEQFAETLSQEFARATVPPVLSALHTVGLQLNPQ